MKVDPNREIDMVREFVLCQDGTVVLHDGRRTPMSELGDPDSAFRSYCDSLDPNRYFIDALIPEDADREVFFEARRVVENAGLHLHIQASVDTPEQHRARWEGYLVSKSAPTPSPEPDGSDV